MRRMLAVAAIVAAAATCFSATGAAKDAKSVTGKNDARLIQATGIEKTFLEGHEEFRQQHDDAHEKARITNRAKTAPSANNGYTQYKYTYIPKYLDCVHVGEEAGNVVAAKGVYNVTVVSDPSVLAEGCPALIGNVVTTGGDVANYVEIQGSVTAIGQPVAIGNTIVIGPAGDVTNSVTIEGSVRSTESVAIGNTQIQRGHARAVRNRVSIRGRVRGGESVKIGGTEINDAEIEAIDQTVIIQGSVTAE